MSDIRGRSADGQFIHATVRMPVVGSEVDNRRRLGKSWHIGRRSPMKLQKAVWVIHAGPQLSKHGEGVALRSKGLSRLSRHPVLRDLESASFLSFSSRGRVRSGRWDHRISG
jgi:hypothetical protein